MGGGLVAVVQILRGMQRTGGEGWTAAPLVCGCVHGEGGRCAVACVLPFHIGGKGEEPALEVAGTTIAWMLL